MRLIDPIELKRSIAASSMIHDGKTLEQIIDEQPTIEERKTGRWIKMSDADGEYYCCDQCGEELNRYTTEAPSFSKPYPRKYSIDKTNFCPKCGAIMMEVEHETDRR